VKQKYAKTEKNNYVVVLFLRYFRLISYCAEVGNDRKTTLCPRLQTRTQTKLEKSTVKLKLLIKLLSSTTLISILQA